MVYSQAAGGHRHTSKEEKVTEQGEYDVELKVIEQKGTCGFGHKVGDVIAFRAWDGQLVLHRLIGYRPRRDRLDLIAQGDASARPDVPVRRSRVIGRVVANQGSDRMAAPRWQDRVRALARYCRVGYSALIRRLGR